MLFTSYEFLLFLATVIIIYYLLPGKYQWMFLLFADVLFYYLVNPWFCVFLAATTITVYAGARLMAPVGNRKKNFRFLLCFLLFNIGILAIVKYTDLFYGGLLVPMGISFYTFQALGYLIDVYRGKYPAQKNFPKFALFVTFFPQLVQGPISRYDDLSKTLYEEHCAKKDTITLGLQRILWGYFKKLVIADRLLPAVQMIISDPDHYRGTFVLVGMMFYALELYADFTGGIDITIGIAQTLGIKVAENFKRPYFSKSVKEYWTRWHITMGTWFRDYLFYPLSVCKPILKLSKFSRKHFGSELGKRIPVYVSSLLVWSATGIWHGRGWNFLVWGIGNFVIIMVSKELEPCYRWFHQKFSIGKTRCYQVFQILRTIFLMSCLRMLDCYQNVPLTFRMFESLFTDFHLSDLKGTAFLELGLTGWDYIVLAAGTLILIIVSLLQKTGSVRAKIQKQKAPVRFLLWYGLFLTVLLFGAYGVGYDASQFIYNRF
jgi:D-alanyl-lipoteichoic acid acyltransferase DltB (MBOAT superfamily)